MKSLESDHLWSEAMAFAPIHGFANAISTAFCWRSRRYTITVRDGGFPPLSEAFPAPGGWHRPPPNPPARHAVCGGTSRARPGISATPETLGAIGFRKVVEY